MDILVGFPNYRPVISRCPSTPEEDAWGRNADSYTQALSNIIPLSNYTLLSAVSERVGVLSIEVLKRRHTAGTGPRINYLPIRRDTTVMTETDGEEQGGQGAHPSLLRRAIQRIVRDFKHDIQGAKRKGIDIIPSAFILLVEKWLGFWTTLIGLTFTVGALGMGLVYVAEMGSTIPPISNSVPWLLGHLWAVGLLIVLTYGVVLFSLLLVSAARLILWIRDTYLHIWNRDTPPFTPDGSKKETPEWPPSDQQRQEAWNHARDYLGNGAILFVSIVFVLLLAERIAQETVNELLSSPFLTIIGNSLDVGIGFLDFNGALGTAAPNARQPELALFVLFFVIPAAVMAIGTRNLLYLIEGQVRVEIEKVREGNLLSRSTAMLVFLFLYSIGIFANILIELT